MLNYRELTNSGSHSLVSANPFEPLFLMHERGNPFSLDATGFIEVDFIGILKKKREDHLFIDPLVSLDKAELDLLDASQTPE
ncbi:hypothetical protein EKD16_18085 [Streptomonospora litoralis]|uniref:Uncharacterized protein n=1 Tax=Streptomonospora litoralis TaxID=2498135 RepID=A0A4P6Q7G8_9ACTN|nr:hypothetical protein EKD16_18085 [Streptomonospora litoralis]